MRPYMHIQIEIGLWESSGSVIEYRVSSEPLCCVIDPQLSTDSIQETLRHDLKLLIGT